VSTIDRRTALRFGVLGLALAGSAVGTARLATGEAAVPNDDIDEIYKGRHIQIHLPVVGAIGADRPRVYIDGAELHVMAVEYGRYTSVMNHYQSFPTLLSCARAAVDNLRGAMLIAHS
jgi:hypothetical protein